MVRGISLGSVLAVVISFVIHKSIAWAVFHGLCGWLYVFYYVLAYVMRLIPPLTLSGLISIFG